MIAPNPLPDLPDVLHWRGHELRFHRGKEDGREFVVSGPNVAMLVTVKFAPYHDAAHRFRAIVSIEGESEIYSFAATESEALDMAADAALVEFRKWIAALSPKGSTDGP